MSFEPVNLEENDGPRRIEEEQPVLQPKIAELAEMDGVDLEVVNQKTRQSLHRLIAVICELEVKIHDVEEDQRRGTRKFLMQTLGLVDSVDRMIKNADPQNELVDTLDVFRSQFFQFLEDHDVFPIEVQIGDSFDPATSEVANRLVRPDLQPDVVISVERRGYSYLGKPLRKARVIISKPS